MIFIEKIVQQDSLQLIVGLNKILGVFLIDVSHPIKRAIYILYCCFMTIFVYTIYPLLEVADAVLVCETIPDYTQNLCLTLCHTSNTFKVYHLVLQRHKFHGVIDQIREVQKKYVKHPEQVNDSNLFCRKIILSVPISDGYYQEF